MACFRVWPWIRCTGVILALNHNHNVLVRQPEGDSTWCDFHNFIMFIDVCNYVIKYQGIFKVSFILFVLINVKALK